MWSWPEYSQELKVPPVRILILDEQGVLVSSGRNTLSPVTMHCPDCEVVLGDNYLTACDGIKSAAGSPDARAVLALREVLEDERKPFRMEYGLGKSGSPSWFQIMIFPLEGERRGALLLQVDVTERRESEEELRRSHDEIRSLARRLIHAQEEERKRIARELHDDICQRLAVHALQINSLRRNMARNHVALQRRLDQLEKDAAEIGNALRDFSHQLHPVMLEEFGLVAAIRDFCAKTAAQYGLKLELNLEPDRLIVAPELAISLFRIVQEAFSNVAKHARASCVRVTLNQDNAGLLLCVEDDGVGFEAAEVPPSMGFGLISMKERARSFSGVLQVDGKPGHGTRISVEIPLNFAHPHETTTYNHC